MLRITLLSIFLSSFLAHGAVKYSELTVQAKKPVSCTSLMAKIRKTSMRVLCSKPDERVRFHTVLVPKKIKIPQAIKQLGRVSYVKNVWPAKRFKFPKMGPEL